MSYSAGGEYISRAYTVEELIDILKNDVPSGADIKLAGWSTTANCSPIVEVWYDESANTVILK